MKIRQPRPEGCYPGTRAGAVKAAGMDFIYWLLLKPRRDIRVLPGSISIVAGVSEDCLKIEFAEGELSSFFRRLPQSRAECLMI